MAWIGSPVKGAFSVTVPGAVDGWVTLLERYGTMSLEQVLGPAIEYAEEGFPVSEIFAADWSRAGASHEDDPEFVRAYYIDGKPPAHGDVFVNEPLAWTYRQIAHGGRDAFYKGEIARRIVDRLNSLGWPMTMDDLAAQQSDWVKPISTTYKGNRIYELPPNGQGMAALEILNILEGYDLRQRGHNSASYLHLSRPRPRSLLSQISTRGSLTPPAPSCRSRRSFRRNTLAPSESEST